MQPEEFKAIDAKFKQGLEKLERIKGCLRHLAEKEGIELPVDELDRRAGELAFWYAGTKYYVKIRITDQDVDDLEPGYRLPIGWLDWGRSSGSNRREPAEQSNYFDERTVLCEFEKEEFYATFLDCDDEKVKKALMHKLQKLASRTIAINNIES